MAAVCCRREAQLLLPARTSSNSNTLGSFKLKPAEKIQRRFKFKYSNSKVRCEYVAEAGVHWWCAAGWW